MKETFDKKSFTIQKSERFNLRKEENISTKKERLETLPEKEKGNDIDLNLLNKLIRNHSPKKPTELELYDEETKSLLKEKKIRLEKRMGGLIENYKKMGNKGIYDIIKIESNEKKLNYLKKNKSKDVINNRENGIKKDIVGSVGWKIYFFGFLYFTFYLVGFFQLLDLFDSCKKETGIIFKSFFTGEKKESNETFVELYINSCFKNIPEFDFAFITSILGSVPLKFGGFFISSLIYTILNSFLFINFIKLDFEKAENDFFDFFHISLYFLLFFISFGSISLFPHEKITEGIALYEEVNYNYSHPFDATSEYHVENEEEIRKNLKREKKLLSNNNKDIKKSKKDQENKIDSEDKRNEEIVINQEVEKIKRKIMVSKYSKEESEQNIFIIISIGIILAYIINKLINYLFYRKMPVFYHDNFKSIFLIIYTGSYAFSLFFYFLYYCQIIILEEIDNSEESEENIQSNYFRLCGYLIYSEKNIIDNNKEENKNEQIDSENPKKEDEKEEVNEDIKKVEKEEDIERQIGSNNISDNKAYKIDNKNREKSHVIYTKMEYKLKDNITIDYLTKKFKINYKNIFLSVIFPCFQYCKKDNKNSKYCCASCKLGWRKFFFNSKRIELYDCVFDCCKCEECCVCCPCCQKCCVCCEKLELKESYEEEELFCYIYQTQRKCSWFCDLFFKKDLILLIIINIFIEIGIIGFEKKVNENLEEKGVSKNFPNIVVYLAFFVLYIFLNAKFYFSLFRSKNNKKKVFYLKDLLCSAYFFITIISGFSAFGKKKLKNISNDWFVLFPLSYTKYINFLILDNLINIVDEENIDILTNSFIVTSIFFIYDILVFIVTDVFDCSSNNLILFQFILGCISFPLFCKESTKKR